MSRRMYRYATAFGAAAIVWLAIVLGCLAYAGFTLEKFAQLGDGLAPLGSIPTAGALMFAFEQHRETQAMAHVDRLLDAYATWFAAARVHMLAMQRAAEEVRVMLVSGYASLDSQARVKAHQLVTAVLAEHHAVGVASARVMLLEYDEDARAKIAAITNYIGPAPRIAEPKAWDQLNEWHKAITGRRDQVFELMRSTRERFKRGKIESLLEVGDDPASWERPTPASNVQDQR